MAGVLHHVELAAGPPRDPEGLFQLRLRGQDTVAVAPGAAPGDQIGRRGTSVRSAALVGTTGGQRRHQGAQNQDRDQCKIDPRATAVLHGRYTSSECLRAQARVCRALRPVFVAARGLDLTHLDSVQVASGRGQWLRVSWAPARKGFMDDVIALILGGGRGTRLFPLTQHRSKPAVPIGGNYRLIDVAISNCLHAGIRKIFVLTQYQSESLNKHIGSTYKFDMFSSGFVEVLAAEQTEQGSDWFQGTADAVRQCLKHVLRHRFNDIAILGGDMLYRHGFPRHAARAPRDPRPTPPWRSSQCLRNRPPASAS